ncbi:uncharacterized protein LOC117790455 [Drosophila innubila]|uniref:uncharacterized protein LOC117790455 n=1 Tax=Drosophila innubila TaxID=198719 RepID=UPI00148CB904|nr:uncharacterized protein LOC117790455 [Drosophila innubila]
MENTSTMSKRRSLTLSSRLLQKRHSASPQNRVRASATQDVARDGDTPRSPTVNIVENVESTPPNKKMHSLDDSLDFSPHNNLSPSCLFSQTLVTGSPEVSWRWNCDGNGRGDKVNTTSDSGFDSEEFGPGALKQIDRRKQVRVDAANEHRRKQLDNKQWRAQQIRDHELLRERCDKLHRQLDQQLAAPPSTALEPEPYSSSKVAAVAADPALADFLNDSDTDCFLLEASQQLESDLAPKQALKQASVSTTPTSHHKSHKEKRSSFYMKFLEDESETEDWFVALDEAMLEATQPKKPRTSLQRYKSMPSNTASDATISNIIVSSSLTTKPSCSTSSAVSGSGKAGKADTPGFKRHASSHALSPATSSVRGNLFGRRK